MSSPSRSLALGLTLSLATALPAAADDLRVLDTLTVVGVAGGEQNVAGSVDYIDAEALELQGHSDVLRILRTVPGVNIQEEEGYGLRPNIGLRGSGSDRNSRITVMEDGVPIAPAIYASPSAYYFPATGRIHAIEVTKGPGVIQYGPRTSGGAVHLFSTPIPDETSGYAEFLAGDYGRQRLHAFVGTRQEIGNGIEFGALIETFQDQADGFLERDLGAADTGFDVDDYVVKAGLYGPNAATPWSLELKYQTKDEVSNQTYLGLTDEDFAANPYRLYDAAGNDQMVNENELFQLTGKIDLSSTTSFTAAAYSNEFARNWYKLHGINADGGGASGDVGLTAILEDPETFAAEFDLIRGVTSLDDGIVVRANNRIYYSRGISGALDTEAVLGGMTHHITIGGRIHSDEEDRFQKEDAYSLNNGVLALTTSGPAGGTTNRVTGADAIALYALDRIEVTDRLQVTAGLRFEDYEVTREDFSTSDPTRSAGPTRVRTTEDDVVLPSLAVLYSLTDTVDVLAGVHKGFSPAGASDDDVDNEESWNYEAGARFTQGALSLEGIFFFNDYDNLLGECTASSGGACEPGDVFNGDAVEVSGLEVTGAWDAATALGLNGFSVPVTAAYTYTDTEFQTSFDSSFFGEVEAGDELNYVPDQQFTVAAGIEGTHWGTHAVVNYVSETRGTVGSGSIPSNDVIDERTLVDISAFYEIAEGVRLKAKVENLFDESYIAARRPSGLRPGKPQEVLFGVDVTF